MRNIIVLLLTSSLLLPLSVRAGTTGKIVGRVYDRATQERLPGANVVLEGTTLGVSSDLEGNFVIINVPPGTYTLRVSFVGYAPLSISNVRVTIDQTTEVVAEMVSAAVEFSEVTVVAERPLVRKDATGTVAVVGRDEIKALAGVRNFTEVLATQAGVVTDGSTIHIRGGRGNEVAYMIDGLYVEDPLFGGLGTQIHNDAIEQMQFLSGTFSAEYGDAMSGVVNIVTREGREQYQTRLEGRTSEFAQPYSSYREGRVVGSFSGPLPLLNGPTFYFSGERDYRGSWLPWGYDDNLSGMAKLTHRISEALKATGSYRQTLRWRQGYAHSWKYIPEQYYHSRTRSLHPTLSFKYVMSDNAFLDVRTSYFYQSYRLGILENGAFIDTSQYLPTSQRVYKSDAGNGFEFYAKAHPVSSTYNKTKTINLKADLEWQADAHHEIKTGFELKKHELTLFDVYDPKRNFPYINNYFRQPFEAALYVQDKIEFPSLVVNAGLRFDYADQRAPFRDDPLRPTSEIPSKPKMQLSPRIGIAHPITDRTNLHFSYGHFFQNPEYQYLYDNSQYDLNVREPIFGQPDLDAQRTVAYEVGVSHQLANNLAVSLTGFYKDVTGLIGTHYYPAFVEGRFVGYTVWINEDYGNVRGFMVDLTLRRTGGVSGQVSYTNQSSKASASSEGEQYPGTQESTLLYYTSFDKTHVFNASLSVEFRDGEGWSVFGVRPLSNTYWNFLVRASSGFPYTPGGRDAGFVIRNSARMPWSFSVDAEAGKIWKLFGVNVTVFLEALNLADYKNVLSVYTDTGLPDVTLVGNNSQEYIKDPSNFGPPRRLRLGLRLEW